MSDAELDTLLGFFKALSDGSRLKIVGVLATRQATVGELSAMLGLKPPTVSHHLARLRQVGLIEHEAQGTSRVYRLVPGELERLSEKVLGGAVQVASEAAAPDQYDAKVMTAFVRGETLLKIPSTRRKRDVILRWLVEDFEWDVRYAESEVNERLQRHHWDCATLRREFIACGLMERENQVYWRV